MQHKTSAWPLAGAYALLIVYASLYPFSGWRNQEIPPWEFLFAGWPKYWTVFDLVANVIGYVPLGFLLALSFMRRGNVRYFATHPNLASIAVALVAGTALSFVMEAVQTFLPSRVASNVDFGLNVSGTLIGAITATGLELGGAIDRWSRFRERWFIPHARGALVLLALWPFALLFPAAVPLGLGQVLERLETAVAEWLEETPFLEWMPLREVELQPLVPAAELLCVGLGAFIPCLLGYTILRSARHRAVFAVVAVALGASVTALSAALSWGPQHAWAWLSMPVRVGLLFGLVLAMLMLAVPRRGCAAVLLLVLVIHLAVLNQAPASAYFTVTLQEWEQGRFIRFHGLAQWLGWLWPYAVLVYVLLRVSRREAPPTIPA
ncbi:VanZ family protein [Ramlibacter pallidus]|uniref:VanZ family protein n=1 Tax=Ramlibacter pallidus TaxID=2780087 RepID=A0ABR9S0Q9_9BURK|nr:VanZ family protein [Ramlibacter pallidus]MBE7367104.1 VanZ family protein [Ramlibacter pallidus]